MPIVPTLAQWEGKGGKSCSRRQLPLHLAYGVTIHKSQGLTLDRVVVHLGETEFSRGLAFVACSRVKTLATLAFDAPFPPSRLLDLGRARRDKGLESAWEKDAARREKMGFADEDFGSPRRYEFAEDGPHA